MQPNSPKRHPLNQSQLYAIQSRAKLAEIFGLTRVGLDSTLAMERPFSQGPKGIERNGKTKIRMIQQPRGPLRTIHAKVRNILSRIDPPDFLFCPVKQRSYVSNATQHVTAKVIRTLDIQAYFPSPPSHRVYWFFHRIMACSPDVASVLQQLLTVNGHLAIGSTVSPILSFFAFYDMWDNIAKIARGANCNLTVYMDDVTISGDTVPESIIWAIRSQVHGRGLRYHKERHYTKGLGEVTGALIKDGKIAVPNRQLKKTHEVRMKIASTMDINEIRRLTAVLRGLTQQRKQMEG